MGFFTCEIHTYHLIGSLRKVVASLVRYISFKMIYVALLCVLGQRHRAMGNFRTLCRSVRLFTTAYAVTRR